MPVDSVKANTEPTFGILTSVFGIFWYCKYRHRYRYLKTSDIRSVFRYTDPRAVVYLFRRVQTIDYTHNTKITVIKGR